MSGRPLCVTGWRHVTFVLLFTNKCSQKEERTTKWHDLIILFCLLRVFQLPRFRKVTLSRWGRRDKRFRLCLAWHHLFNTFMDHHTHTKEGKCEELPNLRITPKTFTQAQRRFQARPLTTHTARCVFFNNIRAVWLTSCSLTLLLQRLAPLSSSARE